MAYILVYTIGAVSKLTRYNHLTWQVYCVLLNFPNLPNLKFHWQHLMQKPFGPKLKEWRHVITEALLKELREGIASLSADRERLPLTSGSAETTQRLSALYKKTISQISPKIIIKGQPKNLTIGLNTERIRSLLLAGVRSAVLWRQVGGGKLDLVFNRKKIIRCCEELKK